MRNSKSWIVARNKPNQDKIALINLERQNFEFFQPTFKTMSRRQNKFREIIKPAFPGYIFIAMNLEENNLSEAVTSMTSHINVGSGEEISIKEASILIKDIVGYHGNIVFNASMPDGAARKFLDNSKIEKLGWSPTISFKDGLKTTYNWFLHNQNLLKDK